MVILGRSLTDQGVAGGFLFLFLLFGYLSLCRSDILRLVWRRGGGCKLRHRAIPGFQLPSWAGFKPHKIVLFHLYMHRYTSYLDTYSLQHRYVVTSSRTYSTWEIYHHPLNYSWSLIFSNLYKVSYTQHKPLFQRHHDSPAAVAITLLLLSSPPPSSSEPPASAYSASPGSVAYSPSQWMTSAPNSRSGSWSRWCSRPGAPNGLV